MPQLQRRGGDSVIDELWRLATNDGENYKTRDAASAVRKAFVEYQRIQREAERENFREIREGLIRDLAEYWKNG